MLGLFKIDHDWTGNLSAESAQFSHTFHPGNFFMSFCDSSADIASSFDLIKNANYNPPVISLILKAPGLATLLVTDALNIIVAFHLNEAYPDISDPAWVSVAEGIIAFNSGKVQVDNGSKVEVGILLAPGNYVFRVYFGKFIGPLEPPTYEWRQNLAIYFHKTETEETDEIQVLKEGSFQKSEASFFWSDGQ